MSEISLEDPIILHFILLKIASKASGGGAALSCILLKTVSKSGS